jgi:3-hydroxyisobutyrate dehydrogenase
MPSRGISGGCYTSGSSAASTLIRRDVDAVFRGDYLASFGLDRICEELEAVTALARPPGAV